jgi:hypothetical protein
MTIDDILTTHQADIACLLALWQIIHGGDPGPEGFVTDQTTLVLAGMLAAQLSKTRGSAPLTLESLKKMGDRLGAKVVVSEGKPKEFISKQGWTWINVNGVWVGIYFHLEPLREAPAKSPGGGGDE